jgi:hypothetical protein
MYIRHYYQNDLNYICDRLFELYNIIDSQKSKTNLEIRLLNLISSFIVCKWFIRIHNEIIGNLSHELFILRLANHLIKIEQLIPVASQNDLVLNFKI